MKKITLKSATDDLAQAGLVAVGAIGGYYGMDLANSKFNADGTNNLLKWGLPVASFGAGLAVKMLSNSQPAQDISIGLMVAGVLDGIKKGLQAANITAVKVPSINGMGNAPRLMEYNAPTTVFRGLGMDSGLLKGDFNSKLLV
jgi:hypothetical protein